MTTTHPFLYFTLPLIIALSLYTLFLVQFFDRFNKKFKIINKPNGEFAVFESKLFGLRWRPIGGYFSRFSLDDVPGQNCKTLEEAQAIADQHLGWHSAKIAKKKEQGAFTPSYVQIISA